jgi:hypothetical protein
LGRLTKTLGVSVQIDGFDFISLVAIAIAVGSLFYAKKAVELARENNKINLLQPRKEIFEAMFDFRRLFVDMDAHPTDDEIQDFYLKVVLPSHVYFSGETVQKMYEIYKRAFELYKGILEASESGSSEQKWELTYALQDLGKNDLDQLLRDITVEIDIGST